MGTAMKAHAGVPSVQVTIPNQEVVKPKILSKSKPTKNQIAVDLAHPGQSYKPDIVQHNEAIRTAVDIEKKRADIEEYLDTPVANGLSDQTLEIILNASEEESDDETQK